MLTPRWDRLATVSIVSPISRLFARQKKLGIPILMYHAVGDGCSDQHPYYEINVRPKIFADHVRQLHDEGYVAVSLDQALHLLRTGGSTSKKTVVITFDDGYRDFYQAAFPILAEYSFTATVFLVTGEIADQRKYFKDRPCLTWSEIDELQKNGISFGSHTATHPRLTSLSGSDLDKEIAQSKDAIETRIGVAVRSFSYPYAFPEATSDFVNRLRETLAIYGYENGVTTILGTAHSGSDPFFLPRLPINTWDDPQFFQAKLEGHYDWLHSAQYLAKRLRNKKPTLSYSARCSSCPASAVQNVGGVKRTE